MWHFYLTREKLYVYGILEEEGVAADFKDLVTPYLKGLAKIKKDVRSILLPLYWL